MSITDGLCDRINSLEAQLAEARAEARRLKEAMRVKEANRVEAETESIKVWDELQRQNAEVGRLLTCESLLKAERDAAVAELRAAARAIDDRGICERDVTLPLPERLDAIIVDLRSARHHAEMDAVEARKACKGLLDYMPGDAAFRGYLEFHGGDCMCRNCENNREALAKIRRARALVEAAGLDQREEVEA